MARKPSHLASYCMPGGIVAAALASIGFTGGITGRSMVPIVRAGCAARRAGRGGAPGARRGP